jgi:hypothetical protein
LEEQEDLFKDYFTTPYPDYHDPGWVFQRAQRHPFAGFSGLDNAKRKR